MQQSPGMLLKGRILFVDLRRRSMDSNKVQGHDLRSSAWFEKLSMLISGIGFARCYSDHSMFVRRTKSGSVILVVYVDDIGCP